MNGTAAEVSTLRRLHELMCRVNAGEDLPTVLQLLVDGVAEVAGFAVAAVSILRPDQEFEVLAVAGDDAARAGLMGLRTPVHEIVHEFEIAENWGVLRFIPHERLDGAAPGWVPDFTPLDVADAWHPEDALLAPLHGATGELVGLLSVDLPRDGRRPGRSAREALDMYAVQAGIAISNAKQRDQAREEIRLAGVVRHVAVEVAGALAPTEVADAVVAPISEGLRADAVWLRTLPGTTALEGEGLQSSVTLRTVEPTDAVVGLAARVAREAWAARRAVVLAGTRPLWEVEGHIAPSALLRPAVTEDELETARRYLAAAGCHSILLAPVGAGPEFLGYLLVARVTEASSWTAEEVEAVLEIGREVGRALLRAQVYDELKQLDRHKSEMFATVAHELKNPLTAITGHVELLDGSDAVRDDLAAGRSVSAIDRATTRLTTLVDDLLVLARLRDPLRPLAGTEVDLLRVVRDAADLVGAQAQRHQVEVHVDVDGLTRLPVLGEPRDLDRVVANLLSNAVKFSTPGSAVAVRLRDAGDAVVLECSDHGLGISEADQRQLFTEFFRSTNPVAQQVPGTGLGLAIVHRIVTRHGGSIDVRSAVGEGTTFTVTLPAAGAGARVA